MGSYNVACSVSHISLNPGEPCVYIPLGHPKYVDETCSPDGNNNLVGRYYFYAPATLPIFGTYNDYGRIGNIQRDANTDILEKFFNRKIEQLCCPAEVKVEGILSGMFVIRDVYEVIKKTYYRDYDGEVGTGEYWPSRESFRKSLEEYSKLWESMKKMEEEYVKSTGQKPKLMDHFPDLSPFRDCPLFCEIYGPMIRERQMWDEVIEFAMFEAGLYAVNTTHCPAMNGCQCGNPWMEKAMLEAALEAVNRIIEQKLSVR